MAKPLCIVTEPDWMPADALERLRAVFDLVPGPFTPQELEDAAANAHGYFVGLDHRMAGDLLSRRIQFVASPTTGLNHIDLELAKANHIEVISLKGEVDFLNGITATSELCWGLILSLTRKIPQAHRSVVRGEWDRDRFISNELKEATLGIVGVGRLGSKVASYARAFDMRVMGCNTHDVDVEGVEMTRLNTLLGQADIISLHADSRPENYHMIGAEQFARMKNGAYFINTARGDLVDEAALLAALRSGKLAGAALDVLEQEFAPACVTSRDLIAYAQEHDNLILTPHIGGVSYESQYKTTHFTIDKLLRWWSEKQG